MKNLLKGINMNYALAAIAAGVAGGYILAKKKVFSSNYAYSGFGNNPNSFQAAGGVPNFGRNFPNRTDLYNSVPNPEFEIAVPYDTFSKYATVHGMYDSCNNYVGTP